MIIDRADQLDRIDFTRHDGLVPVVAQHAATGEVLMLAWANRAALEQTLLLRQMCYWSRSRGELWHKGASSGNVQQLITLHLDCDADAVLARVLPAGPACHTGERNCFGAAPTLVALDDVITVRAGAQAGASHTQRLLSDANLRLKKLGEEAVELVLACERGDRERVAEEAADLLYHALVAVRATGVSLADVLGVLEARRSAASVSAAAAAAPAAGGRASAE